MMAKGTLIISIILTILGLAVCAYPLASGFVGDIPGLTSQWSVAHSLMMIGGGVLVAVGVWIELRAEQVERTRLVRSSARKKDGGTDQVSIRESFVTGWSLAAMVLLPVAVGMFYIGVNEHFEGLRKSHGLMFGLYLAAVLALPIALYFTKMALHQKSKAKGRSARKA